LWILFYEIIRPEASPAVDLDGMGRKIRRNGPKTFLAIAAACAKVRAVATRVSAAPDARQLQEPVAERLLTQGFGGGLFLLVIEHFP
jgi:hypothetical protein